MKNHNTGGKISIDRETLFLSKYISKVAIDLKLSSDVGNKADVKSHRERVLNTLAEIYLIRAQALKLQEPCYNCSV